MKVADHWYRRYKHQFKTENIISPMNEQWFLSLSRARITLMHVMFKAM